MGACYSEKAIENATHGVLSVLHGVLTNLELSSQKIFFGVFHSMGACYSEKAIENATHGVGSVLHGVLTNLELFSQKIFFWIFSSNGYATERVAML